MKWCLAPPKQSGEIPDIDPVADEIAQGTDLISKDSHTTRDPESKRIQTPECRLPVMKPRSTSISLQPALPVRGALVRRSWCTAAGSLDSPPVHPLSSPVRLPSCTSTKRPPCISTSTTPEDRIAWALPKRFSYQRRMAAPLGSQRTLRSDNNAAAQTQARVLRNIFLLGLMPNFDEKAWTDFPSSKQISGVLFWGQLPRTCSIHEPLLAAIIFCQSCRIPQDLSIGMNALTPVKLRERCMAASKEGSVQRQMPFMDGAGAKKNLLRFICVLP